MLKQNTTIYAQYPLRFLSGNTLAGERAMWGQSERRNIYFSEAGIDPTSGIPNGNLAPGLLLMPQKSGGMASYTSVRGAASVDSNAAAGLAAAAALTGSGDVTSAQLGLIVSLVAALSGNGTLGGPQLNAIASLLADLTGSGDLAATRSALANALANLLGVGGVTNALSRADGFMGAAINVTGSTLTTANVADAVWGAIADSGYTYEQVVRLLAAAIAGASTGGPGSPVFKALDGTTPRIAGAADSSGNRSGITYTP